MAELFEAARSRSDAALVGLARKIEPIHDWDQIVLPADSIAQLREICAQVVQRHRVLDEWGFARTQSLGKGVSALFAGPSGTGKTMAAEIIARELGLDLYKIDLSGVVSKYIGETEKNLERIFAAAENANAILFFDEADALFGKRSEVRDSHDRYANIEIAYLLQRMEQYEGVAILATNLRQNMDEAFVRRLQFVVEFPFPDEEQRARIWPLLFPAEAERSPDIDFDMLARQFRVTGGSIKNIVLGAAFLAASEAEPIGHPAPAARDAPRVREDGPGPDRGRARPLRGAGGAVKDVDVLRGLLYAHNRANANTSELCDASATVQALADLLVDEGVIERPALRSGGRSPRLACRASSSSAAWASRCRSSTSASTTSRAGSRSTARTAFRCAARPAASSRWP